MNIQMARKCFADLQKLRQSISIVIDDIENIIKASDEDTKAKPRKAEIPPDDVLRNAWRELQQTLRSQGNTSQHVNEFVQDKTKRYLQAFCKANDLPISNKYPKDKISQQLVSLVHIGFTITGRS